MFAMFATKYTTSMLRQWASRPEIDERAMTFRIQERSI